MPFATETTYQESVYDSNATFREKVIPQNIEAEKAVLAAVILDPDILEEAVLCIKADAFYRPSHQKIFTAIAELYQESVAVDQISLAERLRAKGELESIGGKAYILELADNSFALANWQRHVEIVNRQALLRKLIMAATKISALSYDAPDSTDQVVEEAEKLIFEVTDSQIKSSFQPLGDLINITIDNLEKFSRQQTHMQGVPTGFRDIDRILAGMRGGDLIVIAARPGVGKTSLALNIAVNAAKAGTSVAFFSLEMPSDQLIQRVICTEALVDLSKMRRGNLTTADWEAIIQSCDTLSSFDFSIVDTPSLSVLELRAKARRQLHNAENGLIIVDYLQLMETKGYTRDRHLEVAEFSRGLKMLAKELKVPVIALSQLSRRVEERQSKVPQLSDLRESGSIEQDADVVMFIDRSLSENEAESSKSRPPLGIGRVIVGKNRNGPTGSADLLYESRYTKFMDQYYGEVEGQYAEQS